MTGNRDDSSGGVTLIGGGFVADLYMRSLRTFPDIPVHGVFDRDAERMRDFASHWGLTTFESLDAALAEDFPALENQMRGLRSQDVDGGMLHSHLEASVAAFSAWYQGEMAE